MDIGVIELLKDEMLVSFNRSSGPGDHNVNKVSTTIQLRFGVEKIHLFADDQKARLRRLAGSRMTAEGILIIEAKRYRSQEKNKADAIDRFGVLLQLSGEAPKLRRKTRPTMASRANRLDSKKRDSIRKRDRQKVRNETE